MKMIIVFFQIIILIGVGYYILEDTINMDPELLDNIYYDSFVGKYEYIEDDGDQYKIHWIQLNEDGTWKDHRRRAGFYLVEGDEITFYQKLIAFYRQFEITRILSDSFEYDGVTYSLPSPFESPESINYFHRFMYWSPVKYANAYEVFVNGELYQEVSDTWIEVDYESSDFIDVKVRAIDVNNQTKNGAFTQEVTMYPNLVNQTTSQIINLSEVNDESTISIPSHVLIVEINGLPDVTYENIYIKIEERTSNLIISLNNVNIDNSSANSSKAVIYKTGLTPFLTIVESNGTLNRIKGRNGGVGTDGSSSQDGGSGGDGFVAVVLFDVYFKGSAPITIIGGSGGKGGKGGDSGIFATAGDGGNGGDASSAAYIDTLYYDDLSLINLDSGSVGLGGSGGTGGFLGSNGTSGRNGTVTEYLISDFIDVFTLKD